MYQEAFKKLDDKETAELLTRFNPLFDGVEFTPLDTTIMAQDISFYDGYRYLDITDDSIQPSTQRFAIDGGQGREVVLDWSNAPIYALNKSAPLILNDETAPDYVRFFFNHVRGEKGRMLIAENVDDIRWKDDPPPEARKNLAKMLIPLSVKEITKAGSFILPATIMFKDSLFQCEITIANNGEITIANEHLLVEDIPVLDDALGQ
ncbi:MAG: hypothetical protein ACRBCT_05410 [Alphaproteobacteria bacterium]